MESEDDLRRELERMKSRVQYEQIRAQNLADRAESEAKYHKDRSTEVLAIVSVLLLCSVLIILGLSGVLN